MSKAEQRQSNFNSKLKSLLSGPDRHIVQIFPTKGVPGRSPLHDSLEDGVAEQADRTHDETPDDYPILVAVALEALRRHVVLVGVLAEVDALAQAEGLCALGAGRRRRPPVLLLGVVEVGSEEEGPLEGCVGVGGLVLGAQGDNCAVLEAGALAKRRRGWKGEGEREGELARFGWFGWLRRAAARSRMIGTLDFGFRLTG